MQPAELIALRCQPPRVELHEAQAIAHDLYGVAARAESVGGERDRNFLLHSADRRLVLKFIDPAVDDVIVAGQSAVLAHLAEQDAQLGIPHVIPTLGGRQSGCAQLMSGVCRVRLVTFVAGDPLPSATPTAVLLRSAGTLIARLDRALQGFNHAALLQPIAWDIRHAQSLLPVLECIGSPPQRDLIATALAPLPELLARMRRLRAQAIHGDCHPGNLLASERGDGCAGVIDFGDMIHGPLILEVAVAVGEFLAHGLASEQSAAELIHGYTRITPLEDAEIDVLFDAAVARIATGILIRGWRAAKASTPDARFRPTDAETSALERLLAYGKDRATAQWRDAAARPGTAPAPRVPASGDLLTRRRRALGANAELSYEQPLHLVRAEGVWMYDASDARYLDVYNNVPHVGHAHPTVVSAVTRQLKRIASNTRYLDETIIEYAERLTATLPPHLDACLFVNSGSEANDVAWRIATSHTGHRGALVMTHAYHGITEAVTALSPSICAQPASHIEQLSIPVASADSANLAAADADRALTALGQRGFEPAVLILDTALTSSGIFDPPPGWVAPIVQAVRTGGGLIIADEVQFGLGRSGSHFWGFSRRGFEPDIVTLGKPVGNGYPLGVVVTRRALLEEFQRASGFFSTFGGNPVAAAAAIAVLDVLKQEKLQANALATGDYFVDQLRSLAKGRPLIAGVRGQGLMIGVEIAAPAGTAAKLITSQLVNGMRTRGVLIGSEGPQGNVLKLRPPLPFQRQHVDIAVAALSSALHEAAGPG